MRGNPMQSLCGAHCRTTGNPCQNYPMANGRCRMHGGKGSGRPIETGRYTGKALAFRRGLRQLNHELLDLMTSMNPKKSDTDRGD